MSWIHKISLLILFFSIFTLHSFAHPGRTDSNGGHYNRATGEYHYHDGKSSGGSGSNSNTDRNDLPPVVAPDQSSSIKNDEESNSDSFEDKGSSSESHSKNSTIDALLIAANWTLFGTIPLSCIINSIIKKLFDAEINMFSSICISGLILFVGVFLIALSL